MGSLRPRNTNARRAGHREVNSWRWRRFVSPRDMEFAHLNPDLEIKRRFQPMHGAGHGIPAIRIAAGSLGTSKITDTRREPQSGHFNLASKLVSGNALPLVQIRV